MAHESETVEFLGLAYVDEAGPMIAILRRRDIDPSRAWVEVLTKQGCMRRIKQLEFTGMTPDVTRWALEALNRWPEDVVDPAFYFTSCGR